MNSNPSAGRITAIIAGGVLVSIATLALALAASLAWIGNQDADGFYTTSTERFSTRTHALTSEDLDIDGIPGDPYGSVRLSVRSNDDRPVFAGIARSADVRAYLANTAYATLEDFDVDPFSARYRLQPGSGRPAAPAKRDIWVARAEGTGTRQLTWDVEDGDWSVVVMNADGSAGVEADISAGADLPILDTLADVFLVGGLVFLAGGGALTVAGMRRPRRRAVAV